VYFPVESAPLRTDASFRSQTDSNHHSGETPLLRLNVGLVSQFVLDYMHLVCLGVTKKIITLWYEGPRESRLGHNTLKSISTRLQDLHKSIPCEFSRPQRSIYDFRRWKATELREFLLYTAPVALEDVVPEEIYENFMLLSVAMFILLKEGLCREYNDYAKELLLKFVKHFAELYGESWVSYNVHSLIHLPDDAQRFGNLNNVSAFPFENAMQHLQKQVRKPSQVIQQVVKRYGEISRHHLVHPFPKNNGDGVKLKKHHHRGPLPDDRVPYQQFKKLIAPKFTLAITCPNNAIFAQGRVYKVTNILQNLEDGSVALLCQAYLQKQSLYNYPISSKRFGVFKVSTLGNNSILVPLRQVDSKCILLPMDNINAAFPL
jgi:hypothetical protein